VNASVTQLDQMTQQNAALVEESAAAAESLKGQAQQLAQMVGMFRLGNETGFGAGAASHAPAKAASAKPASKPAASKPAAVSAPRPSASKPVGATPHNDEWESF